MNDYGNAIKILRKRNQMTQTTLAERLNISGQAVSKWENNLAQPDFDTILKLTGIFNITLDEFSKLCTVGEGDATPAQAEVAPAEAAPVPAPAPMLIGVCFHCGRSIYEEKAVGTHSPRLLCVKCKAAIEKRKQEEEKRRIAEAQRIDAEARAAYQRQVVAFRRSMIFPGLIIGSATLLLTLIHPIFLLMGALLYLAVVQIRWGDNCIANIFFGTFGRTFAQPGLIIPFSLDGFIWAFCVKIAMAIIWFLIACIVTIAGFLLCMILSPIFFPSSIQKAINAMHCGQFR